MRAPADPAALQNLWTLTQAEDGQKFLAAALGAANLVGVGVLSSYLRQPGVAYNLAYSNLGFMVGLMPYLKVCPYLPIPGCKYSRAFASFAALIERAGKALFSYMVGFGCDAPRREEGMTLGGL